MASLMERAIGAARLDVRTYEEVEADTTATGQAMAVVVAASLAAGIGSAGHGLLALVLGVVISLVGWFVWAAITYFVGAKLFPEPQTEADVGQLLRTLGFAAGPGVLRAGAILPLVGWLLAFAAWIWQLVAMVVAVRQALDYRSTGRAVLVCLVGFVVYVALMIVPLLLLGTAAFVGKSLAG